MLYYNVKHVIKKINLYERPSNHCIANYAVYNFLENPGFCIHYITALNMNFRQQNQPRTLEITVYMYQDSKILATL